MAGVRAASALLSFGGLLVLLSFVYSVVCRLFRLVLLLARGDRSKELVDRRDITGLGCARG